MTRREFLKSAFFSALLIGFSGFIKRAEAQPVVMNETGARIYKGYKEGRSAEQIASDLVAEYDVSFETALKDTQEFIALIRSMGL